MIFNDPAEVTEEAVEGFVDLYSERLRSVPGGDQGDADAATPFARLENNARARMVVREG